MTSRNYKLRLEGISSPAGEISLRDLSDIGEALQQTATRIARQVAGSEGRGRPPSFVDRLSELRLAGLSEGSTILSLRLGEDETLPLDGDEESLIAQRFEEAFSAIARNEPPPWASPLVKKSIGRFVDRVASVGATRVTASWGGENETGGQEVIAVSKLDITVWDVTIDQQTEELTMTGRLDKVDLRARRFRVRDDIGNDVTLDDVVDVDAAARLIGQRVIAHGIAERNQERVVRIVEPTLILERLPQEWSASLPIDLPAGGEVPTGGIRGVSAADVEEFLAEIRA